MITIAPTPWSRAQHRAVIYDAKHRIVADCNHSESTSLDDIEIANRIVRAVNNHDALVTVVHDLLELLNCVQEMHDNPFGTLHNAAVNSMLAAHKALAAASGETS